MNLFRFEIGNSWRGLLGWSLGLAAAVLLYIPLFPSLGGADLMEQYLAMFPAELSKLFGLDRMGSGAGYVQATYFGLTAYLLLAIAATGWGAAAIAGQEEDGRLELTLAHAVTRWQIVIEHSLAILFRLLVLTAVGSLLIWALDGPSELALDPGNLVAVSFALFLVSALIGHAALCAGAISGRRSVATGVGAGIAVAAYAFDAVALTADLPWLADISPFSWAFRSDPITSGADWAGLALLAAVAVALTVLAGVWFNRRDVGT